jgi:hypothetical protein
MFYKMSKNTLFYYMDFCVLFPIQNILNLIFKKKSSLHSFLPIPLLYLNISTFLEKEH